MKKISLPTHLIFIFIVSCLSACSSSFSTHFDKGKNFYQEKNYVQAVDQLNLAIPKWKESNGNDARGQAYELLGKSYHALGNLDRAADAYKEAIKHSDKSFDAAYSLGIIYLTANQTQPALITFRKALEIRPDDSSALIGLGNTYFELRDYPNAIQMYQRIIDTTPGVKEALQYIALAKDKQRNANARSRAPIKATTKKKPSPTKAVIKKKKNPRSR